MVGTRVEVVEEAEEEAGGTRAEEEAVGVVEEDHKCAASFRVLMDVDLESSVVLRTVNILQMKLVRHYVTIGIVQRSLLAFVTHTQLFDLEISKIRSQA